MAVVVMWQGEETGGFAATKGLMMVEVTQANRVVEIMVCVIC